MNITYKVPKRKANRIVYRIGGMIFLIISIISVITVIMKVNPSSVLTCFFALMLGGYGLILVINSFRKQSFDIEYTFTDDGVDVTHHYGKLHYNFEDIEFVTMVIADQALTYYILNMKAKKEQFVIPFPYKGELCERIYEHINSRIKHDDEDIKNNSNAE